VTEIGVDDNLVLRRQMQYSTNITQAVIARQRRLQYKKSGYIEKVRADNLKKYGTENPHFFRRKFKFLNWIIQIKQGPSMQKRTCTPRS
jgi:hypothetical protein